MRRTSISAGAVCTAGYLALHRLGRTAGSTATERRCVLPGDGLVDRPSVVTDHATTIDARPTEVWPWLVQMGWHRGGWYTARWVDRLLFPANAPSADRLVPELQHLTVGGWIPDGPPESGCGFVVRELEPARHLVLHSTEHLPPGFRQRFGARIDWSWQFVLVERADRRTRFHFRSRARLEPRWLAAVYRAVVIPADFVMGRQMLHGLKRRVEATSASTPACCGAMLR